MALAVGLKSEQKLVESFSFRGMAPEFYSVGDCVKPHTIKEATEEGFGIA